MPLQPPSMFGVPFGQRINQPPQAPPNADPNSSGFRDYQNTMKVWSTQNPAFAPMSIPWAASRGKQKGNTIDASARQSPQNRSPFANTGGMVRGSNPFQNDVETMFNRMRTE